MRVSIKYLLLGAGFGGLFPVVSTLIWIASHGHGVSLAAFAKAQSLEPLLWVIDSAPLFLGLFAWMAGVRQEKLEAVSQEASNDLQQLFRISQDILCICDTKGFILRCNPAFEKLLGQKPDSFIGKALTELVHPEDREQMGKLLSGIVESGSDLSFENRLVAAGVEPIYVEWSISRPLQGKFLAIGRDSSLKKKNEAELTRNTENLERSLHELDKFAYVISHDLKSPLRGMHTLADFIAEDLAEGKTAMVQKHLALLRNRVDRMQRLIVGVLEYSRAGKDLAHRSPIYLPTFLKDIKEDMALPDGFTIEFPDQLPTVVFNPGKLRQILGNLISNSIRFNDQPQGKVTIECEEQPSKWVFSLTDTGPGIPERYHEQIFDMFRTLKNHDAQESTGIGLPIVKKIVEEAGGTVYVDREYRQGARIVFTILRN